MNSTINYKKYCFVCIIILLICGSCALNRSVRLYPVEPFSHEENGVNFMAGNNNGYGFWIGFFYPHVNSRPGVFLIIHISSDCIIENMFLESVSFLVEDLGIIITKEHIHESIKISPKEDTVSWKNPPEKESYGTVTINNIYADEIRDSMSEKLSIKQMHEKFKNVKKVSFAMEFSYQINGDEKSTMAIFKYETKYKASIAWIDSIMSI